MGFQNLLVKIRSSPIYQQKQIQKECKYLGVVFQRNGTCHSHTQQIHAECLKRLNYMRMLMGTNWGVAKAPLVNIYRALICLAIEYGVDVTVIIR